MFTNLVTKIQCTVLDRIHGTPMPYMEISGFPQFSMSGCLYIYVNNAISMVTNTETYKIQKINQ